MHSRRIVYAFIFLWGLTVSNVLAQNRFTSNPSFSVAGIYDDNFFFTASEPTKEFYARYTPTIALGYGLTRALAVSGSYSFDAEIYPNHPDLSNFFARQRASAGLRHSLSRASSWSLGFTYTDTNTPRDLFEDTDLDLTRRPAQALTANAGFSRKLTRGDTLTVGYTLRRLLYQDSETQSQALILGWTHQFTSRTLLTISGGPNYADELSNASVSVSVGHQLRQGSLSLRFSHQQNPVPSDIQIVVSQSLSGGFSYALRPRLQVAISPGLSRHRRDDIETWAYGLRISANYQVNRWLFLQSSYRRSYQQGSLDLERDTSGHQDESFRRSQFLIGLTFGFPSATNWMPF